MQLWVLTKSVQSHSLLLQMEETTFPRGVMFPCTLLQVLYDGEVLGKFCGNENSAEGHHPGSEPLLSPGNTLTLIFKTDSTNPERHQNVGFSAHYQAIGGLYRVS